VRTVERRQFVGIVGATLGASGIMMPPLWGQVCDSFGRCPPSGGDNGVSISTVHSHTNPVGPITNKVITGGLNGTDVGTAHSQHVGLFSYYYNLGEDLQMLDDLNANASSLTPTPADSTVNKVLAEMQARGATAYRFSHVKSLLTIPSSTDVTNAINYANVNGVYAVATAFNRLLAQAQKNLGGGGSGDGQLSQDCANMKNIMNLMFLLAAMYGLATLGGCVACPAIAGGFVLTGAILRFVMPAC